MSLKAFHIFFICVSTLLTLGFAAWEFNGYMASGELTQLIAAVIALVAAIGLVLYGIRFMRKLKHVRML